MASALGPRLHALDFAAAFLVAELTGCVGFLAGCALWVLAGAGFGIPDATVGSTVAVWFVIASPLLLLTPVFILVFATPAALFAGYVLVRFRARSPTPYILAGVVVAFLAVLLGGFSLSIPPHSNFGLPFEFATLLGGASGGWSAQAYLKRRSEMRKAAMPPIS